ncbi:SDR family NAD(P)-dependent oxidoreductase [Phytohabitans sp. ZYX-F-186]|uniref:SDR family NAD(P)-dependent oxidoreductase n=1 Tax=Phytohabitans maris TaxID=3071409 RepID=A0ABU0ZCL5_9ACTN|nr:SDR family NAD(P)-dependent oxidoreductase [Phytohabitans sp. ZYX-F-186]MDQ7904803.1 SDR family NAD(P)-dependent oxidoreductase [Phytohabitans sp. ZYX-F-186]
MQLEGKRTIVTGGASGIAAATVLAYAREGASVVSVDINDEAGQRIADEANRLGSGKVTYRHLDISDQDAVNHVFDEAVTLLGGLDVLANIAGNEAQKPAEDVTAEDIDKIFNVHVKGMFFTNAAAYRAMQAHGGSIINASSGAGVTGYPGSPVYSAAKAAMLGYIRTVAFDWGDKLIRINAILPAAETDMTKEHFGAMDPETLARYKALYKSKIPLGGWLGTVEQIAAVNVFLASDASSFITGQAIAVDGGWTMVR